ncbi:GSCFA domain-containing protein, partial [Halovulum sp. GXIMD14793]
LIIPMIWTSVKRLFRIRLLLQKVEQTLHQNEGSFGGQVTLRAVAGELAAGAAHIDYFPSYEMITGPGTDGRFFAANRRSVTAEGVAFVMDSFAAATGLKPIDRPISEPVDEAEEDDVDDVICEEIFLDAFADKAE